MVYDCIQCIRLFLYLAQVMLRGWMRQVCFFCCRWQMVQPLRMIAFMTCMLFAITTSALSAPVERRTKYARNLAPQPISEVVGNLQRIVNRIDNEKEKERTLAYIDELLNGKNGATSARRQYLASLLDDRQALKQSNQRYRLENTQADIEKLLREDDALAFARLRRIIDPKKLQTAEELVNMIDRTLHEPTPQKEHYKDYEALVATGLSILSHTSYVPYLANEGLTVLAELKQVWRDIRAPDFQWTDDGFCDFKKLLALIPTIKNPNEDLFVEVFDGWTDEEIRMFVENGYLLRDELPTLSIHATRGCRNQCLFCAFRKQEGKIRHMPFPLLVKLLRRTRSFTQHFMPYLPSEPFMYHDAAINATIADIVLHAQKYHFTDISLVTHGGYWTYDNAYYIASRITVKVEISFHAFHRDVVKLIEDEKYTEQQLTRLLDKYSERFVPLMLGLAQNNNLKNIRFYQFSEYSGGADVTKAELLQAVPNVLRLLKKVQEFQEKLLFPHITDALAYKSEKALQIVWRDVGRDKDEDAFEKNMMRGRMCLYFEHTNIDWMGQGMQWLQKMMTQRDDVDDQHLCRLKKPMLIPLIEKGAGYYSRLFHLSVDIDGNTLLLVSENANTRFRTVGQMFASSHQQEFIWLCQFLRLARKSAANNRGRYLASMRGVKIDEHMRSFLRDGLGIAHMDGIEFQDFVIPRLLKKYIDLLSVFFVNQQALDNAIQNDRYDQAYHLLKDVPFPLTLFLFNDQEGEKKERFRCALVSEGHRHFEQNLCAIQQTFTATKKVFMPRFSGGIQDNRNDEKPHGQRKDTKREGRSAVIADSVMDGLRLFGGSA